MTATGEYLKRAIKRRPVGPVMFYLDCECGAPLPVDYPNGADAECICGRVYDARGWILTPRDGGKP